jgi:ribosomal-protein-alanine N-acetyltransferase
MLMPAFDAIGTRVAIRRPTADDCNEFIHLMQVSREFHLPWLDPAKTPEDFDSYLRSRDGGLTNDGFLICCRESGKILGLININCIVWGFFASGYLGYYLGAPYARQGYMTEGMKLVTRYAFSRNYALPGVDCLMALHRLEANIQPGNLPSIGLVRKCGFRKEGFSPRYLYVLGQWCDHERWAITAEEVIK